MNANELADIQAFKTVELTIWERNTTATMLRQQQAEIEGLINANRFIQNFAEEQHQRAVALEMRELTDEEIAGAVARGWCSEKNSMKVMDSDLAWAIVEEIKAILRKVQEK